MGKYLTRDAILAADDLQYEDVYCPEWADSTGAEWVCVRAMTGMERSEYQTSLLDVSADGKDTQIILRGADVRAAALCMVDSPRGVRLFSLEEVELLGAKNANALNRVAEVAKRLSALTKKDMEELTSNLKATPSDDSTSA